MITLIWLLTMSLFAHSYTLTEGARLEVESRNGLNIRREPNRGKIGVIPNGGIAVATGETKCLTPKKCWAKVTFTNEAGDHITGWVYERYINVTPQADTVETTDEGSLVITQDSILEASEWDVEETPMPSMDMSVHVKSRANFRAGPSKKDTILGSVANNTEVEIIGRPDGDWIPVKVKGTSQAGWMHSSLIESSGDLNPLDTADRNLRTPEQTAADILAASKIQPDGKTQGPAVPPAPKKIGPQEGAMKFDKIAQSGACMVGTDISDEEAKAIISYYNIKAKGSTERERIEIAKVLFQASALSGGRFEPFVGINFSFYSGKGHSWAGDPIKLNRCGKKGQNCGSLDYIGASRIAHEMAHRMGHASCENGKGNYYGESKKEFQGCYPTRYSDDKYNEGFAEIISAFLTYPERLSQGSAKCQKAYKYLSEKVFKTNGKLAACDAASKTTLMAKIRGLPAQGPYSVATVENAFAPATPVKSVPEIKTVEEEVGSGPGFIIF